MSQKQSNGKYDKDYAFSYTVKLTICFFFGIAGFALVGVLLDGTNLSWVTGWLFNILFLLGLLFMLRGFYLWFVSK